MHELGVAALYSAVDSQLTHYAVDVAAGTLDVGESVELPAKVQYAWPHPKNNILYVATSSGGPRVRSHRNQVNAFLIASDGSLKPHGEPRLLPRRAVHLCVDPAGQYLLSAHNFEGGGLTVHKIAMDGKLGAPLVQDSGLEYGIYPHQVMTFGSSNKVLIVDRGINPQSNKPEAPGALRSFGIEGGKLTPGDVIAPSGGFGFGPRHVVFHPTQSWLYVSDERMNKLRVFAVLDGRIEPEPAHVLETLADPDNVRPRQLAGPIQLHPNGRFLYVANRSDNGAADGSSFQGGENNIAVFEINNETGTPTILQHASTQSIHVRTFALDPSGRLLVAASIMALSVIEVGQTMHVPAALSVFKVGADGTLSFLRRYDVETKGDQRQYWAGIVKLV